MAGSIFLEVRDNVWYVSVILTDFCHELTNTHNKALARAVYARCDILVLDDPFSALDGGTEKHIVQNLLGQEGILRRMKTTVFLITNAGKPCHRLVTHLCTADTSEPSIFG